MIDHRSRTALTAALTAAAVVVAVPAPVAATPVVAAPATLTNLAHLDFLTDSVTPPAQAGHTTYRLAQEPSIGVLWVYADDLPGGGYRRVGGGAYDTATDTYGQGAYDADDVSRAAVVYLRHWRQFGDLSSRSAAYQLLRGLTYLQTATGPNAGNVVLWMQPDGTLNPSPTPTETPDPSDSGASYWLARTIWALGEGYAAFRTADPAFAAFVKNRLDLAIAALDRQVLTRYGEYQIVDGRRVPAWLVVDGADASAEGIWAPQACHSDRDNAHGRIAPYGQVRVFPPPISAIPAASRASATRAVAGPPARTYALRPSTASELASAPSEMSHAGMRTPSTIWYRP